MTPDGIQNYAKKYWKRLSLVFDRDKLKASMYPDRDWEYIKILFIVLLVLCVLLSGYLYLSLGQGGPPANPAVDSSGGGTEREKILNTVRKINQAERAFDELVAQKEKLADPSR